MSSLRSIQPGDRWVLDDAGRIVGVQTPNSAEPVLFGPSESYTRAQLIALAAARRLSPDALYSADGALYRATSTSAFTAVAGALVYVGPYASRPAVSAVDIGDQMETTDFRRVRWYSDGTNWNLMHPTTLSRVVSPVYLDGGVGTTETKVAQWTLPAGYLNTARWRVQAVWVKGATSHGVEIRIRMGKGAASTWATHTEIMAYTSYFAGFNRSLSTDSGFYIKSATELSSYASPAGLTGWNGNLSQTEGPAIRTLPSSLWTDAQTITLSMKIVGTVSTTETAKVGIASAYLIAEAY